MLHAGPLPGRAGGLGLASPSRKDAFGHRGGLFARGAGFQIGQPAEAVDHAFQRRGDARRAAEFDLRDRGLRAVDQEMPGAQRGARHAAARQRVGNGGQQAQPRLAPHRRSQHRAGHAEAIGHADQSLARPVPGPKNRPAPARGPARSLRRAPARRQRHCMRRPGSLRRSLRCAAPAGCLPRSTRPPRRLRPAGWPCPAPWCTGRCRIPMAESIMRYLGPPAGSSSGMACCPACFRPAMFSA